MKEKYKKYIPFTPVQLADRQWPSKTLTKAPTWCSVDLRDGNQALVNPMNLSQKLRFFEMLVETGFKEIEIGFPSANETEYEICRTLIEGGYIPDDVTIQVLVQARPHLIKRTFEAIDGAKNVILHFYNSTSTLQRKVVFGMEMDGITKIATDAAELIRELSSAYKGVENLRFEYSPESFSGTEMDNALAICEAVMDTIGATSENPLILNLPSTVEMSTPNTYADQIEYFIRNLRDRSRAIISLHPHNDRGTAVAAAELAVLAGADRVEGTLFGNGERTGNLDIVTMGMNLYSQGIDPTLDFSDLPFKKALYEECTELPVHERHPYAGELVFTAFSGSHQDAINKGTHYMKENQSEYWEVPYLPIDPADVGRQYEPIIRINSQSGKGGAAFLMAEMGYDMPKAMHPNFGTIVTAVCDEKGRELSKKEISEIFENAYVNLKTPYELLSQRIFEEEGDQSVHTHFKGTLLTSNGEIEIDGRGNGPVDAFFNALPESYLHGLTFKSYSEHAVSTGSDSVGVSFIELTTPSGTSVFGVGRAQNITHAANLGIISAINRAIQENLV